MIIQVKKSEVWKIKIIIIILFENNYFLKILNMFWFENEYTVLQFNTLK